MGQSAHQFSEYYYDDACKEYYFTYYKTPILNNMKYKISQKLHLYILKRPNTRSIRHLMNEAPVSF